MGKVGVRIRQVRKSAPASVLNVSPAVTAEYGCDLFIYYVRCDLFLTFY